MGKISNRKVFYKMSKLKAIFDPIFEELSQVKEEIIIVLKQAYKHDIFTMKVIENYFNSQGKLLRPALIILSAKSLSNPHPQNNSSMIKVATAIELIHNASLIHDDIIDNSELRRGIKTINKQYNNQIAVLIGDLLYTEALSILVNNFDSKIMAIIIKCITQMTLGEVFNLGKSTLSLQDYMRIIKDKTASFMCICCKIGAMLACNDGEKINSLEQFGFNFGVAYQLIDDFKDKDISQDLKLNSIKEAKEYINMAKDNIKFLPLPKYKNSLESLANFIVE